MVSSLKPGPSLYLQEYSIVNASNNGKQRVHSADAVNVKVDVVTSESTQEDAMKTKGTRQQIRPDAEGERETVIYVEPIVDGAAPTALGFKRLEETVNELQQRFQALEELPTNPELMERLKGKITDPLTDVWQIINITKRLDASEQGIDKLTTMVQDVLKGDHAIEMEEPSYLVERLANLENSLNTLDQTVKNLQIIANVSDEEGEEAVVGGTTTEKQETQLPAQRISLGQLLGGIDVKEMHQEVQALRQDVSKMRGDLKNLKDKVAKAPAEKHTEEKKQEKHTEEKKEMSEAAAKEVAHTEETTKAKVPVASTKPIEEQTNVIQFDDAIDSEVLKNMNERISKLEKDLICLREKVDSAPMAGVTGSAELDELVATIHGVQTDMEKLNQTADRLIDDRENREVHLNALLEQVELLKTIKADREDLEDALADKADAQAINRKVSYDQFDAACDDLAQGLEDAIGKLGKQESIWQQTLDEVQKEIEGKVDKIEMTPLKDFVSNRLKSLQDKLKSVAEMRQESEAAGTKKMLRDVQCISCDKNVVMRMEDTNKFKLEPLPCTVSMKPYLTYELDQVRKQHKKLPHSRNMIQFEAALQEEAKKQKSARTETLVKTPRDHLCNRYCGGSHTVTTPHQRVARVGHFITQWGPEIVQLTEGVVKGTDGKMYRSRPMPGKFDVCGPAYCEDHGEEAKPSERQPPASPQPRKSVERQPSISSRKRSSKKLLKEINKEQQAVVEAHIETPAAEETEAPDPLPHDRSFHMDQIIHYEEEEEMGG
ncbi:glutamine-rich protein 2-like [Hylaeus volcanicus]|uniref:glutamine-rich protein 2-like n=1 Tax=Hylaeus volcanicus TaxID=313075 RepID=UPI0023B8280B|nr:glutamine-rich protein 2-like [Hylaeus volcanicus]